MAHSGGNGKSVPLNDENPVNDRVYRQKSPSDSDCQKWRRRGSNEPTENRNAEAANELGDLGSRVSTSGPRTGGINGHQLAVNGDGNADYSPSLNYIAERWPLLQPHIRDAIMTLIDCASPSDASEGGAA